MASAVLVSYVSNIITLQATIDKAPILITILYNELEENEGNLVAGSTYRIDFNTKNLANNEISGLRTIIECTADPAFESEEELSIVYEDANGQWELEKSFDQGTIYFYIPSSTSTWSAPVGYDWDASAYVTTAPDLQPGTTITCDIAVYLVGG